MAGGKETIILVDDNPPNLRAGKGTQFDPVLTGLFMELAEQFRN
jgi:hypothetical protein